MTLNAALPRLLPGLKATKIFRETVGVAFYRLVENFCRHAVKFRYVSIENYFLAAQCEDERFNWLLWFHGIGWLMKLFKVANCDPRHS